jgi:hypothetical protein
MANALPAQRLSRKAISAKSWTRKSILSLACAKSALMKPLELKPMFNPLRIGLESITLYGDTPIGSADITGISCSRTLAVVEAPGTDTKYHIYEAEFQGDDILFRGYVEHGGEGTNGVDFFQLSDLVKDALGAFIVFNGVLDEIADDRDEFPHSV